MSDTTDLIFVFLLWISLDLISLMTFKKPARESRNWKNKIQFMSVATKKHRLLSLVIEISGIILVIYSFSIPWYFHSYRDYFIGETRIFMFHLIDADFLHEIFSILLYYPYLIGLVILFSKICLKNKIRNLLLFEIIEAIFVLPGIMLLFTVQFGRLPSFIFFGFGLRYTLSCPSYGFILYIIGITVLLINGIQFSAYSRFFQS
ncbi:MAG: hypothetical protein HWN80_04015 [Candidatus Lokiarchaeota archaeon]|nr:hypothetical protein [Candidatus Lokiarchaeota archaeon]